MNSTSAQISAGAGESASASSGLGSIIQVVKTMYCAQDNFARQQATEQLEILQKQLSPTETVETGLSLMKMADAGPAVQAYGTVILDHGIRDGRISASSVPYSQILSWYCDEPTLHPLVGGGTAKLLTTCMLFEWPQRFPDLLNVICPEDLASHPEKVRLLKLFLTTVLDSPFGLLPQDRIGVLRRTITEDANAILLRVNQGLFELYTAAGGEGSSVCTQGTESIVSALLNMVELLAPLLTRQDWWTLNLDATLATLLRWAPTRKDATVATAAVLQSGAASEAVDDPRLQTLVETAVADLQAAVVAQTYDVVEVVLQLLMELPQAMLVKSAASVCQAAVTVLGIPSVLFAVDAGEVLRKIGDTALLNVNPLDLLARLHYITSKNTSRAISGNTDSLGVAFSVGQFGSESAYEAAFAEFRGIASALMEKIAQSFPVVCTQYILKVIQGLPPATGQPLDPRTPFGHITQHGPTFAAWESAFFLASHLADALKLTSDHVAEALQSLLAFQVHDKVLTPVFLNLLSVFWKCTDVNLQETIWTSTFEAVNTVILGGGRVSFDDADGIAARKRACTLLISACTVHAVTLAPIASSVFKLIEPLLISNNVLPSEKALLYEAAASLTTTLPPADCEEYLRRILEPMMRIVQSSVGGLSQEQFNQLMFTEIPDMMDKRIELRDSVSVISAVLRRCGSTPYILQMSTTIFPLLIHLIQLIHGIDPARIPPAFIDALDLDPAVRRQMQLEKVSVVQNRSNNAVGKARSALHTMRLALYQSIGAVAKFLPPEAVGEYLGTLTNGSAQLPIHSMKHLTEQCLFPVGKAHPSSIAALFPVFLNFFATQSNKVAALPFDAADSRQLFYIAKDVLAYLKQNVLDQSSVVQQNPQFVTQVMHVALTILKCGEASRESTQMILSHLSDLPADEGMMLYGEVVALVASPQSNLNPQARTSICNQLADAYIQKYPMYADALKNAGVSAALLEELNAHLSVAPRPQIKRKKFTDFLLDYASGKLS